MKIYCKYCETENSINDIVCLKCKKDLSNATGIPSKKENNSGCNWMIVLFIIALFIIIVVNSDDKSSTQNSQNPQVNTPALRGSDNIGKWKKATRSQKLSLCEAMSKSSKDTKHITALDIHNCIDEATRNLDSTDDMSIAEVAAVCVTLMDN
ncbi:MAG: hypothetical protein WAU36_02885 [Cyclobacteriaceae bacterium]